MAIEKNDDSPQFSHLMSTTQTFKIKSKNVNFSQRTNNQSQMTKMSSVKIGPGRIRSISKDDQKTDIFESLGSSSFQMSNKKQMRKTLGGSFQQPVKKRVSSFTAGSMTEDFNPMSSPKERSECFITSEDQTQATTAPSLRQDFNAQKHEIEEEDDFWQNYTIPDSMPKSKNQIKL